MMAETELSRYDGFLVLRPVAAYSGLAAPIELHVFKQHEVVKYLLIVQLMWMSASQQWMVSSCIEAWSSSVLASSSGEIDKLNPFN